jgi:hypothetical protein
VAKKIGILTQNEAKLCNNLIATLVFEKNANFFAKNFRKIAKNCEHLRKFAKSCENCDHNIDRRNHYPRRAFSQACFIAQKFDNFLSIYLKIIVMIFL